MSLNREKKTINYNDNKGFIFNDISESITKNKNHDIFKNRMNKKLNPLFIQLNNNNKDNNNEKNKNQLYSILSPEKINNSFDDDNEDKIYGTYTDKIFHNISNNIIDCIDQSDSFSFINISTSPDIKKNEFDKNTNQVKNNKRQQLINKSIRKKKILNLNSFINNMLSKNKNKKIDKYHENNNKEIEKWKHIAFYYYQKYNIKEIISKLIKNRIKNANVKDNELTNIFITTQIKPVIQDNIINNIICKNKMNDNDYKRIVNFPNNNNYNYNYNDYMEQLSEIYNFEQGQENESNVKVEYIATIISFVINNFRNNGIFNNISKEIEKIKNYENKINLLLNKNNINVKIYNKYHGNIE